jgi:hypothetical protein
METKECQKCKQELSLDNFYFRKETGKYRAACKKCKSIQSKDEIQKQANAELKTCKHCNETKNRSEFGFAGGGKWLQPYCKPCDKIRKEIHRQNNIDKYKENVKEYYLGKRDEILLKERERRVEYRKQNPIVPIVRPKMSEEERKRRKSECDKKYRQKNAETVKKSKQKWYKDFGLERSKEYQKKMSSDIGYVTKKRLRGRVYVALKRGIKSAHTEELLGCSIEYFKTYFESLFTEGMNWGVYLEGKIHIDHIIPCKLFDLSKEEEQKKCFHYSNLQPLFAIDNLKKGTKYDRARRNN